MSMAGRMSTALFLQRKDRSWSPKGLNMATLGGAAVICKTGGGEEMGRGLRIR
jgi:hypothetical protein